MTLEKYEIVYRSDSNDWALVKEDAERASAVADTKEEIIQKMQDQMNTPGTQASVRIRKQNGQYEEERTYPRSMDPASSPG